MKANVKRNVCLTSVLECCWQILQAVKLLKLESNFFLA